MAPARSEDNQTIHGANTLMSSEPEKALGIIYGLAIGDAMGYPTEFLSVHRIKAEYGPEGISTLPEPALFSDDTQMSIAIAEALISAGEQDTESIMEAVKEEFLNWLHSPDNNRAPGRTCLTGVANMEKGLHWSRSGIARSKGCGSAMRASPIGYLYQHDPAKLKEVAHATGLCTHGHPAADAACIGAAYAVKLALDKCSPKKMLFRLLAFTEGISSEWEEAIMKVERCLSWEDEEEALKFLGEGWIGEEAVALALYCFLRYPGSYEKVVIRSANTNGDSDSVACIAGSISGAYLGVGAIPVEWISRVEKSEYLGDLSQRLALKKEEVVHAKQQQQDA